MDGVPLRLTFHAGTLLISGGTAEQLADLPGCRLDPRTGGHRAEARHYRDIVEHFRGVGWTYEDEARAYQPTGWTLRSTRQPFPHQTEALETWWREGGRGVVVLPTGTGKTFLAVLAIAKAGRPAL